MSKRKHYKNPNQLELFSISQFENPQKQGNGKSESKQLGNKQLEDKQPKNKGLREKNLITESKNLELFLPMTYEQILEKANKNENLGSRLHELIVPVTEFEKEIIQVLADIKSSGYLLFLYGASGVGKSTFINSLKFQKYIPIKEIVSINAGELIDSSELKNNPRLKLNKLLEKIREAATRFFSENNTNDDKLCITIDYLENLRDEDKNYVNAFFRDLNGLLRKYAILIIWPVTASEDLKDMQKFAESFSSTIFHRRIPILKFTGPPIEEYPNIAKKTITFFNDCKSYYEFQLHDTDFHELQSEYQKKPKEKHIIREYLMEVLDLWKEKTNYLSRIVETIPKPTEVWFVFSYPEAEGVVARFAKQTPDKIDEMWNADYKSIFAYISENNQRKADWKPQRLTLALSSPMLTTKIMYLPTNALVSCITAYAKVAGISIKKEDFLNDQLYKVPKYWLEKKYAKRTLERTPLYLQLSGSPTKAGKRKSGTVQKGLDNAKQAFQKINEDIWQKKISDQHFNKAICLALQDIYKNKTAFEFEFSCEQKHPYLTNIRPDILVDTRQKYICLEFCYTTNKTPGNIAEYVLRKLNKYMKQLEENFGISHDLHW